MQPQLFKRALQKTLLPDLTRATLCDLGTDVIRDTLAIIQHGKQRLSTTQVPQAISPTQASVHLQNFVKAPAAQLTYVLAEITLPQSWKFQMDWNLFKHITNITGQQINDQLYSSCDAHVQNSIVNTVSDFFTLSEGDLLNATERIVTKRSNPSVYHLTFSSIFQLSDETIQEYIVEFKFLAPDCGFTCLCCNYYL